MSAESAPSRGVLTVAVSTHNRREGLSQSLDDFAKHVSGGPWELLVVANACTDGTEGIVRARVDDFPVPLRVVTEPEPGLSCARNRALAETHAAVVVFVDDDISPHPGWLDAYRAAFEAGDVVAAGGRILPRLGGDEPAWIREHQTRPELHGLLGHYDNGDEVCETGGEGRPHTPFGGNFAVRRSLALEIGAFRRDLGYGPAAIPGEETEFFARLAPHGRILYLPDAAVDHRIQREKLSRAGFLGYHKSQGRFDVRLMGELPRLRRLGRILKEGRRSLQRLIGARLAGSQDPARLATYARTSGRFTEHVAALRRGQ